MPIITGHRVGSTPLPPNVRAFQAINGGALTPQGKADGAVSSRFGVRKDKRVATKASRQPRPKQLTPLPNDGESPTPPVSPLPEHDSPEVMHSGDLLTTFNALIDRMPSHPVVMKVPTKSGFVTHKVSCRQFKHDADKKQLKFLFDSRLFDFSYDSDEQVEIRHGSVSYSCNYIVTLDFVEGSPWRCAIFIAESAEAAPVTSV